MPFDYKKEYKEFYMPKNKPSIVEVPKMNFIAVRGKGDPNVEGGEYKQAIGLLGNTHTDFSVCESLSPASESVVEDNLSGTTSAGDKSAATNQLFDSLQKENLCWISVIRLPDFVKKEDFDWAIEEVSKKKKTDFSKVEFFTYSEGLCVQCMHIGSYDNEPATIELMHKFANESGYEINITDSRFHHEIYLSDPRRVKPERIKTVLRLPIKRTSADS